MKKFIRKGLSLIVVMAMTSVCLFGCSGKDEAVKTSVKVNDQNSVNLEKLLSDKLGSPTDTDKNETVYVEMKADGTVTKTTVSDVLKVAGSGSIMDYTKLDNIINLSGDEQYKKEEDGNILWENKGKDIKYQGTTTETLPLDINITYFLDGKEISCDDLPGKSGELEIIYQFKNLTEDKNGNFVPFITLTGMVLDKDKFANIKIDNGKTMEHDGLEIVVGYSAPGKRPLGFLPAHPASPPSPDAGRRRLFQNEILKKAGRAIASGFL